MKFLIKNNLLMGFSPLKPCFEAKLLYQTDHCESVWYVDIDTLEDILKLEQKYGKITINKSHFPTKNPYMNMISNSSNW